MGEYAVPIVCRSEFEVLDREHLNEVVANNRNKYKSDEQLIHKGKGVHLVCYL